MTSSNKPADEPFEGVSAALRKAGFVCLPRLWVPGYVIPEIHLIAFPYKDAVNEIRAEARLALELKQEAEQEANRKPDPKLDKELAWDLYQAQQSGR